MTAKPNAASGALTLRFIGQVRGGKNNINITRTGHRYPNKAWAQWRDDMVRGLRIQLPAGHEPFKTPLHAHIQYVAGDNRRRDTPAILDALYHCLERAGVVADDHLIQPLQLDVDYDKERAGAVITLTPLQ